MIRFIVSTGFLRNAAEAFISSQPSYAQMRKGELYIDDHFMANCVIIKDEPIKVSEVNWQWVVNVLKNVSDQPIIVEFIENHIKITFEY